MSGQSKKMSLLETCVKTLITGISAFVLQIYFFPLIGIHISTEKTTIIVVVFAIHSILWSYSWRRVFNFINNKGKL